PDDAAQAELARGLAETHGTARRGVGGRPQAGLRRLPTALSRRRRVRPARSGVAQRARRGVFRGAAPGGPTARGALGSGRLRWAAERLGARLGELFRIAELDEAERQLDRERAQLQRVINAVPDPIVLTDSEGRMMVANARAEALFGGVAPKEGESEGRRRAVALNNMLFSAALSQRTLEDTTDRPELPLVDPVEGSDLLFELLSA